eukprot:TRINITY_DN2080_c1_g2_i3.p1 TRINITY_DN2080_c1_g2~~TRINITY_DN2080_c1_g2_i3.p1  ORF type:complete len:605 (-),score=172.32 TRINITY_DN2080_c1_g2_i3:39-1853(-)
MFTIVKYLNKCVCVCVCVWYQRRVRGLCLMLVHRNIINRCLCRGATNVRRFEYHKPTLTSQQPFQWYKYQTSIVHSPLPAFLSIPAFVTRWLHFSRSASQSTPIHSHTITREQIASANDIRVFLDQYSQPDTPVEQREKRLHSFIKHLLHLYNTDNNQPSDKEASLLKMAYVYRSKALCELNRREEALEEITKGEQLYPDSVLFYEKARIYTFLNQFSSAIRYLSKALDELLPGDPLYVEALITRAQCYSQIAENAKALQDIGEAIFHEPHNLRAKLERGRFLLNDNLDGAIAEYESVLNFDGVDKDTQAEAYFRIGYAYLKKGEPDVAIRSLQQSERLDPTHPRVSLLKEILNDLDEKIPKLIEEAGDNTDMGFTAKTMEEEEEDSWHEQGDEQLIGNIKSPNVSRKKNPSAKKQSEQSEQSEQPPQPPQQPYQQHQEEEEEEQPDSLSEYDPQKEEREQQFDAHKKPTSKKHIQTKLKLPEENNKSNKNNNNKNKNNPKESGMEEVKEEAYKQLLNVNKKSSPRKKTEQSVGEEKTGVTAEGDVNKKPKVTRKKKTTEECESIEQGNQNTEALSAIEADKELNVKKKTPRSRKPQTLDGVNK